MYIKYSTQMEYNNVTTNQIWCTDAILKSIYWLHLSAILSNWHKIWSDKQNHMLRHVTSGQVRLSSKSWFHLSMPPPSSFIDLSPAISWNDTRCLPVVMPYLEIPAPCKSSSTQCIHHFFGLPREHLLLGSHLNTCFTILLSVICRMCKVHSSAFSQSYC